jgi:hypothetical protein
MGAKLFSLFQEICNFYIYFQALRTDASSNNSPLFFIQFQFKATV